MRSLLKLSSSWTCLALAFGVFFTGARALAVTDRSPVIFETLCAQCHGKDGSGNKDIDAPAVAGMPDWYVKAQLVKFRDGARGTHPLDVAGARMSPMARFLRQDADLESVSAFVSKMPRKTLPATLKGSIVKGEQRYQICAACHGADGSGNQLTSGPALAGVNDWYLLKQLQNFKSGVRGGDAARDPMGASMRANAMILEDQDMLDVIAYINTLGGN